MLNPDRIFKNSIYEQFARIGKAVSSPARLELLDLICQCEKTVETLARESGLSVANTSRHLQVMRAARLVETKKEGLFVHYRLADDEVCRFFLAMRKLAESRLAELERIARNFLEGREGMEPVDRFKLLDRVREGSVLVLDVRPRDEYRAGHLPGALSIQIKELERRLSEFPPGQEIVAYCRGPYCVLSVHAVELLRTRGFRAIRMEEGVQDWKSLGLPVEVGDN